jgi:hypothetical protein
MVGEMVGRQKEKSVSNLVRRYAMHTSSAEWLRLGKMMMCPNTRHAWHVRSDANIGRGGRDREKNPDYSARAPNLPEFPCP